MSDERYLHLVRQDCPLPPGTPVHLYTRDSGGEEQDRSITQQIEAAREYCIRHGLVLERVFSDEAEKATAVEKRDEFGAMMSDLRGRFPMIYDPVKRAQRANEKPFGVLCWKSNRLGRDLIHTRHVKSDLRLRGITIVSLVSILETGNAGLDALIESFYEYQDEQLLKEISENARRGLAQLVTLRDTDPEFRAHNPDWPSTGLYLGIMPGGVPTGFKGERVTIGIYKRKNGKRTGEPRVVQRIVPDPETWDRCRLAWEMRRDGAALRDIMNATHLFKTATCYVAFFRNLIYTGTLEYGGQRIENFVPALVPMDWWLEEQARRAQRGKKRRGQQIDEPVLEPRRVGARHLLSGILFCGAIEGEEHQMLADCIPAKQGVRGHWDFYICRTKKNSRDHECAAKRIGARILEQSVIESLLTHVLTLENLRPMADVIAEQLAQVNTDAGIRLKAAREELQQVEHQIERLIAAIEDMGLSPSLKDKLRSREAERGHLKDKIAGLEKARVKATEIPHFSNAMLKDWLDHIRTALQSDDVELARQAIRQFVAKVVVKENGGEIYYTFPMLGENEECRHLGQRTMDLRGRVSYTRHKLDLSISLPQSTQSDKLHPDKEQLRSNILDLRAQGMSYREIADAVGLHWTRVGQLLKGTNEALG